MLSKRIINLQESPIRKLVPYADEAKRRGIKIYHLNIGQPDIKTPKPFLDALKEYPKEVVAYGYSQGEPFLRSAISDYFKRYGYSVLEDEIIITNGGSEAILFAFSAIADPGDEIIVFEPYYTNYNGYAELINVKLVPVTMRAEDGFSLPDVKEIKEKITPKTRAILVCSPNNPTGSLFSKDELESIVKIAKENNLFIISDEVYREFVYDGEVAYSLLNFSDYEEKIIVVDSISKRYSACGARIGYLITKSKEVYSNILKLAQARLCPPVIEQFAAEKAFLMDFSYFDSVREEYEKRRNIMYEELSSIDGVILKKPKGAFYMIVKLPVDNSEDFSKWMLSDFNYEGETVMVAPGAGFYATEGKGYDEVRIAYVLEVEKLKRAILVFKNGLSEYRTR